MHNLRFKLPPLNSLVAFEAAARHLSFTLAGEELRVSREAVSRQIKSLESFLGQSLFVRLHRALELTEAGRKFNETVGDSLDAIANAASELTDPKASSTVVVSATIAIATFWLTPRLPRFRRAYPDTTIRMTMADAPNDMRQDDVTVGLRYGDGNWPDVNAIRLFDVDSVPVCSPGYLVGAPVLNRPDDLSGHTLLNLDGSSHVPEGWMWWLNAFGVAPPRPSQIIGLDNYATIIQAALDGQGIALGFTGLLDDMLGDGRLVTPLEEALGRNLGAYLVTPEGAPMSTNTRQFHDWVLDEVSLSST